MMRSQQYRKRMDATEMWAIVAALVIAILMIVFATQVHAQTGQGDGEREPGNVNRPLVVTIDGKPAR